MLISRVTTNVITRHLINYYVLRHLYIEKVSGVVLDRFNKLYSSIINSMSVKKYHHQTLSESYVVQIKYYIFYSMANRPKLEAELLEGGNNRLHCRVICVLNLTNFVILSRLNLCLYSD